MDANADTDADGKFELIFLEVLPMFLNFDFRREEMRGKYCLTGCTKFVSKVSFLKYNEQIIVLYLNLYEGYNCYGTY